MTKAHRTLLWRIPYRRTQKALGASFSGMLSSRKCLIKIFPGSILNWETSSKQAHVSLCLDVYC
uniref:Uncharacterized protein n=1 Tax=Arundo donax TaxID=35708 RepID=A0A0A9DHD5_ARUDO